MTAMVNGRAALGDNPYWADFTVYGYGSKTLTVRILRLYLIERRDIRRRTRGCGEGRTTVRYMASVCHRIGDPSSQNTQMILLPTAPELHQWTPIQVQADTVTELSRTWLQPIITAQAIPA